MYFIMYMCTVCHFSIASNPAKYWCMLFESKCFAQHCRLFSDWLCPWLLPRQTQRWSRQQPYRYEKRSQHKSAKTVPWSTAWLQGIFCPRKFSNLLMKNTILPKVSTCLPSQACELEGDPPLLNYYGLIWCLFTLCHNNSFKTSGKAFHKV